MRTDDSDQVLYAQDVVARLWPAEDPPWSSACRRRLGTMTQAWSGFCCPTPDIPHSWCRPVCDRHHGCSSDTVTVCSPISFAGAWPPRSGHGLLKHSCRHRAYGCRRRPRARTECLGDLTTSRRTLPDRAWPAD